MVPHNFPKICAHLLWSLMQRGRDNSKDMTEGGEVKHDKEKKGIN
jgi:hypothetical protein